MSKEKENRSVPVPKVLSPPMLRDECGLLVSEDIRNMSPNIT